MKRSLFVFGLVVALVASIGVPTPAGAAEEPTHCTAKEQLDVGLVIDRSGSMGGDKIDAAREGAKRLVQNLTGEDQSGLVSYSSSETLDQPLGFDHAATIAEIEDLTAGGSTATGDAIDRSHDDFSANGRSGVRPVMIVLTDGFTNTGSDPVTEAAEAKADGIEIFAIGLGTSVNEPELRDIASDPVEEHFFHPETTPELIEVFANLTGALTRSSVAAESYNVHAEVTSPATGTRVAVNKVNQQTLPNGTSGDVANVTATAGGFEVRFTAGYGEALGTAGRSAAHSHAISRIEDLVVRDPSGLNVLAAETLVAESWSQATPTGAASDAGDTRLAGLTVGGQSISATVPPNTSVPLPGLGSVVLNEQIPTRSERASGLRVNLVHLTASQGANATVEIVISSAFSGASCAVEPAFERPERVEETTEVTPPDVGGPNLGGEGNYTARNTTFQWTDISDTGTPVSPCDDCLFGPLPVGFNASWYNRTVDEFWVSTNGFLTFSEQFTSGCCSGRSLPTTFRPFDLVAGWWEDLNPRSGGTIHYETQGLAPNRVLIVQFTDVPHYFDDTPVSFEFKVFELDGAIEVHYLDAPTDGGDHTIGVQNEDGSRWTEYFHGDDRGFTEHAVRFEPPLVP